MLSDLGNYRYYIPRPYRNLNELPALGSITKAEAETEFVIEASIIREDTLLAEEAPTALREDKKHGYKEYKLDELASVNTSATEDKTISDAEFFADAVSY